MARDVAFPFILPSDYYFTSAAPSSFSRGAEEPDGPAGMKPRTLRDRIDFLVSSLNVARLALALDPSLSARELARSRRELDSLRRHTQARRSRFHEELGGTLARVAAHLDAAARAFVQVRGGLRLSCPEHR